MQNSVSLPSNIDQKLRHDLGLASSLLQKGIRRGNIDWTIAATNALFGADQRRLWRRLAVIAVEDIGLAGLDAIGDAVSALRVGGRGPVEQRHERALALARRLCLSPKCRAVDDLLVVVRNSRHLEHERQRMMELPLDKVAEVAAHDTNPEIAAIAAVYASGVTARSGVPNFGARKGSPSLLFDSFLFGGDFVTVVEMSRDGFAGTGCELFALLPIITRLWNVADFATVSDDFPLGGTHDSVPSCAVDYFTRPGRAALSSFLSGSTETARWMREMTRPKNRVLGLGHLLFYCDGGLLRDRLVWPHGLDFRQKAMRFGNASTPDAQNLLQLFRADFAEFDRMRSNGSI